MTTAASIFRGVMPAITTPFGADGAVDHPFLARHAAWMLGAGCTGIVGLGSLGEGGTLDADERRAVLRTLVTACGEKPVIATVAALSTREAVRQAREAAELGCRGLMVLPPYVYRGTWPETRAHYEAVIAATGLACMAYNNPIAYATDLLPDQVAELAGRHANLVAVKESSADVRRVTALRAMLGDRLSLLVGVDDLIVEGVAAGATGWIAGLVNALPRESVRLFELSMWAASDAATPAQRDELQRLYAWFLPLLRLDTGPMFVHLIKLVQEMVAMGSARVRPPRLALDGEALAPARRVIEEALAMRPR